MTTAVAADPAEAPPPSPPHRCSSPPPSPPLAAPAVPRPPPDDPIAGSYTHEPYATFDDFPFASFDDIDFEHIDFFMDNSTPPLTSVNDHHPAALSTSSATEESLTPTPSPPTTPRSQLSATSGPSSTCHTPPHRCQVTTPLTTGSCLYLTKGYEGKQVPIPGSPQLWRTLQVLELLGDHKVILSDEDHQSMFVIGAGHIFLVRVGGIIRLTHIYNCTVVAMDVVSAPCAIISKPTRVDQDSQVAPGMYWTPAPI